MLPPEIRLNIYKKAFHGARVDATLAMEDESSGGGKQHLIRFRRSKHFDLLLRCRKIYDEALPTYWSEAVLNLVQLDMDGDSPELSRHWMWDHHYKGDEYSHFLCNSLPEVVKTNVKHVRGMMLAPLHGRFVKKNPHLTPTAMLSGFKSLATCEISSTMLCHPEVRMIETDIRPRFSFRHHFEVNNESNTERIADNHPTDPLTRKCGHFKTSWEQVCYEPKALVRKICGIDATGKVVFLVKAEVVVVTVEFEVGAEVPGQATFNIMPPQRVLTVPPSIPTRTNTMVGSELHHPSQLGSRS